MKAQIMRPLIFLLVFATSNYPQKLLAQVLKRPIQFGTTYSDPSDHAKALRSASPFLDDKFEDVSGAQVIAKVFGNRMMLNEFLTKMRPSVVVQARLSEKEVTLIREKTTIRMQNAVSKAEIFSEKWKDMATDERKQAMVEFIRSDEEQVERICDFLNELITPAQQNTLLSKFLEQGAEAELLDPIAIRWLELSATDVAKMSHWLKEANEFFLTKVLEGKVDPEHPMAPEDEVEFRRRKAMLFAHLDDQKLRRILVARGLLTQDESLSAYLKRNAYDKDALIKYVPAFKRASDEDANQ